MSRVHSSRTPSSAPAAALGLLARLRSRARDDAGFTLMETIVSITLLGIIMTATAAFFITANHSTSDLRHRQVGVQLVDDALEQVRSFSASNLLAGRDQSSTDTQWLVAHTAASATNPWGAVGAWLANTQEVYDTPGGGTGALCSRVPVGNAPLCIPTVPVVQAVAGMTFQVNTYVGQCWQSINSTSCNALPAAGVPFFRVVAAASWQAQSCPVGGCTYISTELVNATGVDPIFNVNPVAAVNPAPHVIAPSAPQTDVGAQVNLQVAATGGTGGLDWTMSGAPDGLFIDAKSGRIIGVAPSTPKSWTSVVITAQDSLNRTDSTPAFTWTINPLPTLSTPANGATLTATSGRAFTLSPVTANGSKPFSWGATGLPAGAAVDASTGVLTISASAPTSSSTVVLTLTDASQNKVSSSFTLNVVPPPVVAAVPDQTVQVGLAINPVAVSATGNTPMTWSVSGAPAGITIDSGGVLRGTPTGAAGTYPSTVTATDPTGATGTTTVRWNLNPALVISPSTSLTSWPTDAVTQTFSATGGAQPVVWSATGLPAGLTLNAATGAVTGTPTTVGANSVIVSATDSVGAVKSVALTWTVKLRSGRITNANGLCTDLYNNATADNSPVGTYSCNNGANQNWTFATNGTVSVTVGAVTKCLTLNTSTNPAKVVIMACNAPDPKQQWRAVANAGVVNIVNQQVPTLCLDVPVAGSAAQALDVQSCATDARRSWVLPT